MLFFVEIVKIVFTFQGYNLNSKETTLGLKIILEIPGVYFIYLKNK